MVGGLGVSYTHGKGTAVRALPKKRSKRTLGERSRFVRELVQEVAGLSPYERHVLEMMKADNDKGSVRYLKAKLGSLKRAKAKRDSLSEHLRG